MRMADQLAMVANDSSALAVSATEELKGRRRLKDRGYAEPSDAPERSTLFGASFGSSAFIVSTPPSDPGRSAKE